MIGLVLDLTRVMGPGKAAAALRLQVRTACAVRPSPPGALCALAHASTCRSTRPPLARAAGAPGLAAALRTAKRSLAALVRVTQEPAPPCIAPQLQSLRLRTCRAAYAHEKLAPCVRQHT